MIKILFFIETIEGGGAEKVLRDLVNNMDRTKFDITVHTVWPCDAKQYLNEGIRYRSVYSSRSRFNHLRYRLEAALGLTYRLHIRDNYDIECAYLECGATKIMASSTNKKAKKLAWVHCDLMKQSSNPQVFAQQTKQIYSRFDCVACVSEHVRSSFVELFGDTVKTQVVYNAVNDEEILAKAKQPLDNVVAKRRQTVLAMGTLYAPKNYIRLLKAHKQLLDEGIAHDLWILGEGWQRAELEEFIRQNGLSDSVSMPGFQQNPYPFIREADVLACSSNYEGFSTFITEGVILGKPVVTTACSGMREILGDSEYGLITENDDAAFCSGLRKMLTDETMRQRYAAMASKRGKDFSLRTLVKNNERFFLDVKE